MTDEQIREWAEKLYHKTCGMHPHFAKEKIESAARELLAMRDAEIKVELDAIEVTIAAIRKGKP